MIYEYINLVEYVLDALRKKLNINYKLISTVFKCIVLRR